MINKKESRISHKKQTTADQCDIFCFQQCSDKYEELVVVRSSV